MSNINAKVRVNVIGNSDDRGIHEFIRLKNSVVGDISGDTRVGSCLIDIGQNASDLYFDEIHVFINCGEKDSDYILKYIDHIFVT